ncbi:Ig-specific serine endopeptidase MIP [Mycoplasma procyoni]
MASITPLAFLYSCNSAAKPKEGDKTQPPGDNQNPGPGDTSPTPGGGDTGKPSDTGSGSGTGEVVTPQVQKVLDNLNITVTEWNAERQDKKDILFSKLTESAIKFNYKKEGVEDVSILSIVPERDEKGDEKSTYTGSGEIIYSVKIDGKEYNKKIQYTGFKQQQNFLDKDGFIKDPNFNVSEDEKVNYFKTSQDDRFKVDNKKYTDSLKASFQGYRSSETLSPEKEAELNKIAEELKLDTWENQKYKGFSIPVLEDGKVKLSINDRAEQGKRSSWADFIPNGAEFTQHGVPRYLLNDKYKDFALQTYSLTMTYQDPEAPNDPLKSRSTSGTIWILDYMKNDDKESYPTKWFFGTNFHVADVLNKKIKGFSLTKLNPETGIHTKLGLIEYDERFQKLFSPKFEKDKGLKILYSADDYLNSKPADFLEKEQAKKYKDAEEFADFAVIELDFKELDNNAVFAGQTIGEDGSKFLDKSLLAKEFTNDYANKTEKQIKFLEKDYLHDYTRIDRPKLKTELEKWRKEDGKWDELYLLGYPSAREDFDFDKYEEEADNARKERSLELFTNGDHTLFNKISKNEINEQYTIPQEKWDRGWNLSYALGNRVFADKPGITDEFITATRVGKDFIISEKDKKTLIGSGLSYMPQYYSPLGGASGSSARTQDNKVIGAYHASQRSVKTGLITALRSEGFDYKGFYGSYNLPQYDLIYGGGKDQKTSYRQALEKKYPGKTTNIFKEVGYKIPTEFQFPKTDKK